MFLANLNKDQKPAFLALAKSLIGADGIFADEEMLMMEQYQQEMSLAVSFDQIQINEAEALAVFENAAAMQKKQIFFELTALAYANQDYAEEEHALLVKIADKHISARDEKKQLKYSRKSSQNRTIAKLREQFWIILLEPGDALRTRLLERLCLDIASRSVSIRPGRSPLHKPPRCKRFPIAKKAVLP